MPGLEYTFLGLAVGIFSGILGLGGGVLLIPALVYFFGFTQHQAQGTTLALFAIPIAFFAAQTYYKAGFVNLTVTALIASGFILGSVLGSRIGVNLSDAVLTKVFGVGLLLIALKMLFF